MRRFRRRKRRVDRDAESIPEDVSPLANDDMPLAGADPATAEDDEYLAYDEPDIEPFVPVSGEYDDETDPGADASSAQPVAPAPAPRRRWRLPRLTLRWPGLARRFQWSYLLLALLLFAAGVFGMLLKQDEIQGELAAWWPLVVVSIGGLWMLAALVRRQISSFLGGSAFAGVGLSLLLDTQAIAPVEETLLGLVLVTAGLGIVIRGFLLRQQTI